MFTARYALGLQIKQSALRLQKVNVLYKILIYNRNNFVLRQNIVFAF